MTEELSLCLCTRWVSTFMTPMERVPRPKSTRQRSMVCTTTSTMSFLRLRPPVPMIRRSVVGRITGKSGDLESLFTAAALEFSDLIAGNLQSTANENHSAWTSALTTCRHVWGVVTKWSGGVERYESRIASLQEEWDAAVGDNFGFPEDDAGGIEARRALAGALNDRAQGHWETLEGEAEDNSDNLKGGPTVSNLRELVDSGVLGFAAYNSTRQIMYYPSTFDTGTRDAENMADYLTGEKELDNEYYRLLGQYVCSTGPY